MFEKETTYQVDHIKRKQSSGYNFEDTSIYTSLITCIILEHSIDNII